MLFQVCICGWMSEGYPDGTIFFGLGGQLSCPRCTDEKRNQNIEVYGNVEVMNEREIFRVRFGGEDSEAEFKKIQTEHFEVEQKEVMEVRLMGVKKLRQFKKILKVTKA